MSRTLRWWLLSLACSYAGFAGAHEVRAADVVAIAAAAGPLEVTRAYLTHGITHILFGYDHLLFVLALMLIVRNTRVLVATITAFTLAHSITLALATLAYAQVPGPPVEATIALSILLLAGEIVRVRRGRPSLTQRWPWIVAFTFGLLHGFGFAGALNEVGLPQSAIPVALFFFNVGVEGGQLLFIASLIGVMAVWRRIAGRIQVAPVAWVWRVPPYAIGSVASFWFIQRIAAF